MELYEIAAWGLFALIFAFLGMVLGATWKQMEGEARKAGVLRASSRRHDGMRGARALSDPDRIPGAPRDRERARGARRLRRPRG